MEWTQAQQDAIKANGKNILLSAAAGSGKTAVLIERIKRLIIEDKADIDRFLITTFTNAASAEMKSRLENAIKEELKKENADRAFLKRQLALMPRANISTFHTFSLEVMKRYFYLTDLEPGFKIGDDIEVSIMKNEAADQLFERRFEEDYEAFCAFLEKYSSDRNENRIKANIIALYNEMRSIPSYMCLRAPACRSAARNPRRTLRRSPPDLRHFPRHSADIPPFRSPEPRRRRAAIPPPLRGPRSRSAPARRGILQAKDILIL